MTEPIPQIRREVTLRPGEVRHEQLQRPDAWKHEAAQQAGGLAREVHRGWREDRRERRRDREPRPPASTTAIVALVIAALSPIVLITWHQLGASDYKREAEVRHEALMNELRAQRTAIYGLTDTVAEHHPEAAKVGTKLSRDVAHGTVPSPP